MKRKMNLAQEMDLTREGTAEMTRWCIIIALHQCFGVGKDRLNKLENRAEELGYESLNVAMTANDKGMPSTDRSKALRESWLPEDVETEFRVPILRYTRSRREEQLRMAGNVAAGMVWTLYARACMDVLGYSSKRLNRLREEALANYRQVNEEGHESMSWAMDRLRRCDEERVKQSDRDYEQQKQAFLRRNMAQALGHRVAPAGANVLAPGEIGKKIEAVLRQPVQPESWERRRER